MERGEEETSRDEHDEIVREEETRDELEEISIEEEDWDEVDDGAAAPPSPPPTFEPWRENWESKLREASRERNVGVLTDILFQERLLHKAVERGEIDFVRDLTHFRLFDPIDEDPDLSVFIFKLLIETCERYAQLESHGEILEFLKLEFPKALHLSIQHIDKTNILKIVPVEDKLKNSPSFSKLSHALLKRLKAVLMNLRSLIFLRTPLHVAVINRHKDTAEYLLVEQDEFDLHFKEKGHRDVYGLTPLHYAVLMESESLVNVLVQSPSCSAFLNMGDFSQRTPLHLACARRHAQRETLATDVVTILITNSSVDLNAKDCCGYTPLHWAVHVGAPGVITLLLKRKIKLDEKDVDGKTVVHHMHAAARSTAGDVQRRETMLELEGVVTSDPRVEKRIDRMYRDRQVCVDGANTILVCAALIASVTYGGWLQPPLGDQDYFTKKCTRIFWACNSLSFSFAIAAVMAGAGAVLPVADLFIEDAVDRVREWLAVTAFLLSVSASFVVVAFGAAGFASMTTVGDLEAKMMATTIVGVVMWLPIMSVFMRALSRLSSVKRLLKWYARLFSSPSAPLRARSEISLVFYEQLKLSALPVDFSGVAYMSSSAFLSNHQNIQFPTTDSCRQFCMERDSLFPFRSSEPSHEESRKMLHFTIAEQRLEIPRKSGGKKLNLKKFTRLATNRNSFFNYSEFIFLKDNEFLFFRIQPPNSVISY